MHHYHNTLSESIRPAAEQLIPTSILVLRPISSIHQWVGKPTDSGWYRKAHSYGKNLPHNRAAATVVIPSLLDGMIIVLIHPTEH